MCPYTIQKTASLLTKKLTFFWLTRYICVAGLCEYVVVYVKKARVSFARLTQPIPNLLIAMAKLVFAVD